MTQQKVIYTAPLKALSAEKFNDWTRGVFRDKVIVQLTGDTLTSQKVRAEMMVQCQTADIVLMTSELLDSLTRNHASEHYQWLYSVALVIVDESHIITSPGRGDCVEASIMRFSQINPKAKIWMLSATMPNVEEFSTWMTNLNGKATHILNSSWRPTTLVWHYLQHDIFGNYYDIQRDKIGKAVKLVQMKPNEKFLVFVWDKNTGRAVVSALREEGVQCEFHNADVDFEGRTSIVSRFEDDNDPLQVIVATTTLSWGINTSAQNVVIVGVNRGLNPIDELDVIQAAGRAGRFGKAPEGHVYLICDNPKQWQIRIKNPRPVTSTLLDEDALSFHICAEIRNKVITDTESLYKWYRRTLASIQQELTMEVIDSVIAKLVGWECIRVDPRGFFEITSLGMVAATLYYHPKDVFHWAKSFGHIDRNNLWNSDLALAYALAAPTMQLPYIARSEQERVMNFSNALGKIWNAPIKSSTLAVDLFDLLCGEKPSVAARQFKQDAERVCAALSWIGGVKKIARQDMWMILPLRLMYGVPAKLVQLCRLPKVGAVRAQKLYAAGIKTLEDVVANPAKVQMVVGQSYLREVLNAAKRILRTEQIGE